MQLTNPSPPAFHGVHAWGRHRDLSLCGGGGPVALATLHAMADRLPLGRISVLERFPFSLSLAIATVNPRPICLCEQLSGGKHTFAPTDVHLLSVARAGSESVHHALQANVGYRVRHTHECTLRDVLSAGAKRVLVPVRHPLARLVSGFERNSALNRAADPLFSFFQSGGADGWLSALRNTHDGRHRLAMAAVIEPPGFRSNSLLPITEFYLGSNSMDESIALALHRSVAREYNASIRFVCTEALASHFNEAAAEWGLGKPMPSTMRVGHFGSTTMPVAVQQQQPGRVGNVSLQNVAWVEDEYRADVMLHDLMCQRAQSLEYRALKLPL